ncbi:TPA: heme-degrading domain-containing protein [Pseudomonas putida]|uniref:heme-degrading domain-containing protein n=1 Tax=Pseudomonas putida TaxID=303 RepID=UPI0023642AE9|nr:heme-degrading domain-containing protein [Pseudomonas putida]MDD2008359.1 heme-degrading domain-containing protein [Pseudomonas putida]HDS1775825.1 heme-degrading domain-containing protein [Pseudomonas putida]
MNLNDELALLIRQEEVLQFPRFDEEVSWQLGSLLYSWAAANSWPLVIDVRRFDRPLFFAARPGITPDNHDWVRRKTNTVQRFLRSSYRIKHQLALENLDISQRYYLPQADYASVGGGFPIIVQGTGVIGSITVSGLPDRQDHQLIIDALCEMLGKDRDTLALPAEEPR